MSQVPADCAAAIRRKYPEQVVLVVTRDEAGRVDLTPAGWSCIASGQPPMLLVSLQHRHQSTANIKAIGEFGIAFPAADQAELVRYCGRHSGRDTDKVAGTGVELSPPAALSLPLVAAAVANFECRLVKDVAAGDHTVFVGEVIAAHQHRDPDRRRLYITGPNQQLAGL